MTGFIIHNRKIDIQHTESFENWMHELGFGHASRCHLQENERSSLCSVFCILVLLGTATTRWNTKDRLWALDSTEQNNLMWERKEKNETNHIKNVHWTMRQRVVKIPKKKKKEESTSTTKDKAKTMGHPFELPYTPALHKDLQRMFLDPIMPGHTCTITRR